MFQVLAREKRMFHLLCDHEKVSVTESFFFQWSLFKLKYEIKTLNKVGSKIPHLKLSEGAGNVRSYFLNLRINDKLAPAETKT